GIASLVMTQLYVFDPSYLRQEISRIDYWGIGLLAMWVGSLQIALDLGQERDWFSSHFIMALIVIASAGLVAFIVREWLVHEPVVDLHIFKERTYSTGVFLMTTLGFVLYGSLVLLPIMLQTLLGYPALQAGIAMAPRGVGSLIGMPLVGLLVGKIDARKMVAFGLILGAVTLIWLGELNLNAGYWDIFWPQFIQGASLALLFVPLTTATMDPIPKEEMSNATSMFNLMRNVGGSIEIASSTTYLFRRQQFHTNLLGSHVTPYSPQAQAMLRAMEANMTAHGADPVTASHQSYAAMWGLVQRQAAMGSFVDTFRAMAVVFLLVIPMLFLMKRPTHRAGPGAMH
ncbi:MAG TPA: DHA2 family efflux MFS transporter permease subunit, partial [Bryobacteraceae bacterium]